MLRQNKNGAHKISPGTFLVHSLDGIKNGHTNLTCNLHLLCIHMHTERVKNRAHNKICTCTSHSHTYKGGKCAHAFVCYVQSYKHTIHNGHISKPLIIIYSRTIVMVCRGDLPLLRPEMHIK